MGAFDRRTALFAFKIGGDGSCASAESNATSIQAKVDPFAGQDLFNRRRDVRVLTLHEVRSHLHDRHLGPESAKHLSEFQSDVTATDDQQVWRHGIQVHHRTVREKGNLADTWHRGHGCASANINKGAFRDKDLAVYLNLAGSPEPGVSRIDIAAGQAAQKLFEPDA
jgi:hypothetical protein